MRGFIIYEGCRYWKNLKLGIWGVHHINLSNWNNQTLRFSCNIVIIYGGEFIISPQGDSLSQRVASKWLWFFNYQGPLFALLDWYNQTLRFSCNNIVIICMRVVTNEKFNNWLWWFNHQELPFALLYWYNQTLRFSCNNIVIIYEGWQYWKI